MLSTASCLQILLVVSGLLGLSAKPVQNENQEPPPVRRLDTLAGLTIGSSKATRSLPQYPRRTLDSLGDANFIRSLDSLGGANYLRSLDSLGSANILRNLESLEGANLLRTLDSLGGANILRHAPLSDGLEYRQLDSLGGANFIRREPAGKPSGSPVRSGKRLDTLSGITLGHQKRNFDEVDRTAFDGFNKRNFDEVDRTAFDGFNKRNFDEVDRVGFDGFAKRDMWQPRR